MTQIADNKIATQVQLAEGIAGGTYSVRIWNDHLNEHHTVTVSR